MNLYILVLFVYHVYNLAIVKVDYTIVDVFECNFASDIFSAFLIYIAKKQQYFRLLPYHASLDVYNIKTHSIYYEHRSCINWQNLSTVYIETDYFLTPAHKFELRPARSIGEKNELHIIMPWLHIRYSSLQDVIGINNHKITVNDHDAFIKKKFDHLLSNMINKFALYIQKCIKICLELQNQIPDSLYTQLKENDYILLFFGRDYKKIITFCKLLKCILAQENSDIITKVHKLFKKFVKNNKESIIGSEYIPIEFLNDKKKLQYACKFLQLDIINLLNLISNVGYKFKLYEFISNDLLSQYRPYKIVKVLVNEDLCQCKIKSIIFDSFGNEVKYYRRAWKTDREVFFSFCQNDLDNNKVESFTIIIQTALKHFIVDTIAINT